MDAPAIGSTTVFLPRTHFHVLSKVDPAEALRRWANGETLRQIAAGYQVSPSSMSEWLQRNTSPDDHAKARALHYETRLDAGLERIEQAGDDPNLARAREPYLRRLEWRAAVELPERFGPKQQITHEVGPDLGAMLREARKRVSSAQQQQVEPRIIDVTPTDNS